MADAGGPPAPPVIGPAVGGAAAGGGGAPAAGAAGGAPAGGAAGGAPPGPPPGGAAGPGAPAAGAVPNAAIRTYQEYFSDDTKDPHHGDYTAVSTDFAAVTAGNNRHSAENLGQRATAFSSHLVPIAIASLLRQPGIANDPGRVQVFLRPTTYPTTVVGDAQPWDGNTYALSGDIVNGQYTIVPLTIGANGIFQLSPNANTHVLNDNAMVADIAAHPDDITDHVTADAANAQEVRTRQSTFVPFEFVKLLLPQPLRPKQAFTAVFNAATAANKVAQVRPLLDWLKVAATEAQAGGGQSALIRDWPAMQFPPNAALLSFFGRIVDHDLPDRHPVAGASMAQYQPVINAVDRNTHEIRETRLEAARRQEAANRPKTVEQFMGTEGTASLLNTCQVTRVEDLPGLWQTIAETPKRHHPVVVQRALDAMRSELSVHTTVFLSVNMCNKIVTQAFHSGSVDDLTMGVHILLCGMATPTEAVQVEQQRQQYLLIQGNQGAAPALNDVNVIAAPDNVKAATNFYSLLVSIDVYRVILATCFGVNHPLVAYYTRAKNLMQKQADALNVQITRNPLIPVLVQRYMQVHTNQWFHEQPTSVAPVPFSAMDVISQAAFGNTSWALALPPSLATRAPAGQPPPIPGAQPPPGPGGQPPGGANSMVRNGQYDTRFEPIRARAGVRAPNVRRRCQRDNIALPVNANNHPRCLSYHIRGICNAGCGSAEDHRHNHTAAEQDTLFAWAQEHWKNE